MRRLLDRPTRASPEMSSRARRLMPLLLLGLGSCLQWDRTCGGCLDPITKPAPIPYEWVGPCALRYHDEPKEPGYPSTHINDVVSISDEIDREHHLITFPYC